MSETVVQALHAAAAALSKVSDTPRLDAELLMAEALSVARSEMLLRHMAVPRPEIFTALLARRMTHEPVAYILGHAEFYGLELEVSPSTLIPRGDSEVLIEASRAYFAAVGKAPRRILDLGTGSGCLLLAALSVWPEADGVGVERSADAGAIASRNAAKHGGHAKILAGDWHQNGWSDGFGRFDLILANPPYVETDAPLARQVRDHEPAAALFAGPEGLDDYRILIPQLPALLAPGGIALVEIGHAQAEALEVIARMAGLSVRHHRDLADRPRAVELTKAD